jgi:hypothetical protein
VDRFYLVRRSQHSRGERRLRNDHGARAAVREDVPMVVDRMRHIGRDSDCADAHDGQIGDDPLRSVLADQPDPLAATNPERSEAERQPAHIARRRGPADCLIATRMLGPQKRLVAKPSRLVKEHRRQAAAAVVVHSSPVLPPSFYGF